MTYTFGVRNGNSVFESELKKFLNNIFFPYCNENKIKEVILAGDFLDDRKSVNIKTLNLIYDEFLKKTANDGITLHIIPGNHDLYYKNTITPNSIQPIVEHFSNVNFYKTPTIVNFSDYKIKFIPWICSENEQECFASITENNADSIVTHCDVTGSQHVPGVFSEHGYSPELFVNYEYVLNGHIHTKSQISGNIHNLGTQYHMNWSDYGQKKGFHVLNTETRKLSFISHDYNLYAKIYYDDNLIEGVDPLLWLKDHSKHIENKFIKVIVTGSIDRYLLDKFINKISNDIHTHDIKFIEDVSNIFSENFNPDLVSSNKSTVHIIQEAIEEMTIDKSFKKDIIKSLMTQFYTEALNKDTILE